MGLVAGLGCLGFVVIAFRFSGKVLALFGFVVGIGWQSSCCLVWFGFCCFALGRFGWVLYDF